MKREEMKTIAFSCLRFSRPVRLRGRKRSSFRPTISRACSTRRSTGRTASSTASFMRRPRQSRRFVRASPHGTVLTLVQWNVEQDANGNPIKDANGRFIKKDIIAHTVMQKEKGWGADYPADWPRNGEWEYAAFTADGRPNEKANANNKACFTCHLPHAKQGFVISLAKLNGTFPKAGQTLVKGAKGDVNVASFAFLPAKISAAAGKPLTFFNSDDTPHQITVTNGPRSPVFLRGQKASITIDKPGEYNYICGLHPSMKGVIEVK